MTVGASEHEDHALRCLQDAERLGFQALALVQAAQNALEREQFPDVADHARLRKREGEPGMTLDDVYRATERQAQMGSVGQDVAKALEEMGGALAHLGHASNSRHYVLHLRADAEQWKRDREQAAAKAPPADHWHNTVERG